MRKKGTRAHVKHYFPELQRHVFQGHEIHHIKGSLYRVNNMDVEIHASHPKCETYVFPVKLYPSAYMCLFICGREELVFCLEPAFLRELPLSQKKDGAHYVFNLVAEDAFNGEARLIYKKAGRDDAYPIDVTGWSVPLYDAQAM